MLIEPRQPWNIAGSKITPERVFMNRRHFIMAGGTALALGAHGIDARAAPTDPSGADPSGGLYPAKRNGKFTIERPVTPEAINTRFNNFYEFGGTKRIADAAQALPIRPWRIKIDGEVEQPIETDIDALIAKMGLEERLYRHRCVEAWSMTVAWSGFPFARLVEYARPLSSAKYVRMETFLKPDVAPGQKPALFGLWRYDWPYVEGLTMAEATNDLAFLATGAYGKPLAKQMGAPLRLAVPWKYGFKSIKSIVRFSFVRQRPVSFWQKTAGTEYGFWANVNPDVPHPRWSQATEKVLGTDQRIATRIYNGYGGHVAHLYKDLNREALFK